MNKVDIAGMARVHIQKGEWAVHDGRTEYEYLHVSHGAEFHVHGHGAEITTAVAMIDGIIVCCGDHCKWSQK